MPDGLPYTICSRYEDRKGRTVSAAGSFGRMVSPWGCFGPHEIPIFFAENGALFMLEQLDLFEDQSGILAIQGLA